MLKRLPAAPREARTISTKSNLPETLTVQPYGALLLSVSFVRCTDPKDLLYRHHHLSVDCPRLLSSWSQQCILLRERV